MAAGIVYAGAEALVETITSAGLSQSCGALYYHYTDIVSAAGIAVSGVIRSSAGFRGVSGTFPSGAYATTIPPVGNGWTQGALAEHLRPGIDTSAFVAFCSRKNPCFRSGESACCLRRLPYCFRTTWNASARKLRVRRTYGASAMKIEVIEDLKSFGRPMAQPVSTGVGPIVTMYSEVGVPSSRHRLLLLDESLAPVGIKELEGGSTITEPILGGVMNLSATHATYNGAKLLWAGGSHLAVVDLSTAQTEHESRRDGGVTAVSSVDDQFLVVAVDRTGRQETVQAVSSSLDSFETVYRSTGDPSIDGLSLGRLAGGYLQIRHPGAEFGSAGLVNLLTGSSWRGERQLVEDFLVSQAGVVLITGHQDNGELRVTLLELVTLDVVWSTVLNREYVYRPSPGQVISVTNTGKLVVVAGSSILEIDIADGAVSASAGFKQFGVAATGLSIQASGDLVWALGFQSVWCLDEDLKVVDSGPADVVGGAIAAHGGGVLSTGSRQDTVMQLTPSSTPHGSRERC